MIVKEMLQPKSIVVVGASNDLGKPGGRVLDNLLKGDYKGDLYAINPKEDKVQGIKCYKDPKNIGNVNLAILAIAAKYIPDTITFLAEKKKTKAFIVLSAGFSEMGEEGKLLEDQMVDAVEKTGGSLIGPNCIGVLTPHYKGVFAGPIPKLESHGVDFVSGSGATAVFILESAIPLGLSFSSLFSVGNSAQIGVEEVLQYWDESFDPETSSKIKLIYIEQIDKPELFLKHTRSLIQKGCRIAALKAGTTDAGSRAVSSHTGALAGSDMAVDALFRKAGIVRCFSREELVHSAVLFNYKKLKGENIAVITHAGGPGVMLTDTLASNGLKVPKIEGPKADELLEKLFHGSSVANPIDFLATGTAEQLGDILDYTDKKFDNIDGSVVIFGTPGLFDVQPVYEVLHEKIKSSKKPVYPVLPSIIQAKDAMDHFVSLGRSYIPDEVNMGKAIARIYNTSEPFEEEKVPDIDFERIRNIMDNAVYGYMSPEQVQGLLDSAGIPRANETVVHTLDDAFFAGEKLGYPLVMKVVGPVHKSDVGGVALNIKGAHEVELTFERMMKIPRAGAVLMQPMLSGTELFVGANYESKFGHMILCGMGGIFIEVLKDVSAGLVPISLPEAYNMIKSLKSYEMIKGIRGQAGVNEELFADVIVRLSALLQAAPEILELDLNPLLGTPASITAVDARIKVKMV